MIKKNLLFNYKGERKYVHGSDIYNAILGEIQGAETSNIRFSIHC